VYLPIFWKWFGSDLGVIKAVKDKHQVLNVGILGFNDEKWLFFCETPIFTDSGLKIYFFKKNKFFHI